VFAVRVRLVKRCPQKDYSYRKPGYSLTIPLWDPRYLKHMGRRCPQPIVNWRTAGDADSACHPDTA